MFATKILHKLAYVAALVCTLGLSGQAKAVTVDTTQAAKISFSYPNSGSVTITALDVFIHTTAANPFDNTFPTANFLAQLFTNTNTLLGSGTDAAIAGSQSSDAVFFVTPFTSSLAGYVIISSVAGSSFDIDGSSLTFRNNAGQLIGSCSSSVGFDCGNTSIEAVATTPVPAALPLFATGLGALGLLGRRRKKKNLEG